MQWQWTPAQSTLVISRGGTIPRPACSPELSMCDYFLWGYLKSKAYLKKPRDIDKLKNAINEEITATPYNMVTEEMRTLRKRLVQCRGDVGKCLRDVLFKNKICKCGDVAYFNGVLLYFPYKKSNLIPISNFYFILKIVRFPTLTLYVRYVNSNAGNRVTERH